MGSGEEHLRVLEEGPLFFFFFSVVGFLFSFWVCLKLKLQKSQMCFFGCFCLLCGGCLRLQVLVLIFVGGVVQDIYVKSCLFAGWCFHFFFQLLLGKTISNDYYVWKGFKPPTSLVFILFFEGFKFWFSWTFIGLNKVWLSFVGFW